MGAASINPNPVFANWPTGQSLPTGYVVNGVTPIVTKVPGNTSPYKLGTTISASTASTQGLSINRVLDASITTGMWVVLEVDAHRGSGTFAGCGVLFRFLNSSGASIGDFPVSLFTDADIAGTVGEGGNIQRWRKLVQITGAGANGWQIFLMDRYVSMGGYTSAATSHYIEWHKISIRPASDQEIAAKKATADIAGVASTVSQQASALAGLQNNYASLSSTVAVQGGRVDVQQAAIGNLQGRTAAFFQVEAVAGGRAQLRVYADANGGAGVDIIGNLGVSGDGIFGGTINPEALRLDRFVKRMSGGGNGTPGTGQTLLLYAAELGTTTPSGSYAIEFTGSLQTNVGTQASTVNGRPFYDRRAADGGVRLLITKGGVTLVNEIYTASEWVGTNNINLRQLTFSITKILDPSNDTSSGPTTVLIYAIRGNTDTGQMDEGDYYSRTISADYNNVNANIKVKWTFI